MDSGSSRVRSERRAVGGGAGERPVRGRRRCVWWSGARASGLRVYDVWMIYLGLAAAVSASWVAHGVHPRTPVLWDEAACMTVVDRGVSPVVQLSYAIPYEDTELHEDEAADSRRHQFLALCHDYPRYLEEIPTWITRADVDKAAASGVDGADSLVNVTSEEVLEESAKWQGCWTRITGDDERRPITFPAAMEPVVWDTSGLPVGPQVVLGYTWEPIYNIWKRRIGVVQIVDELDPVASPPAIAVSTISILVEGVEDVPPVEGCVRAMEGSKIRGLFTVVDYPEPPDWQVFADDVPVVGGEFSLPLVLPEEALNEELAIRVEVTDPLGRRHVAHMDEVAIVLVRPTPKPAPEDSEGGSEGGGSSGSNGGEESTAGDDVIETCRGCVASEPASGWGMLALLLLARRRRQPR